MLVTQKTGSLRSVGYILHVKCKTNFNTKIYFFLFLFSFPKTSILKLLGGAEEVSMVDQSRVRKAFS